jgi:hypothetical protein
MREVDHLIEPRSQRIMLAAIASLRWSHRCRSQAVLGAENHSTPRRSNCKKTPDEALLSGKSDYFKKSQNPQSPQHVPHYSRTTLSHGLLGTQTGSGTPVYTILAPDLHLTDANFGASRLRNIIDIATPIPANFSRRPPIHLSEYGVESTQAPEAGAQGDIGYRKVGGIEQAFSALHAHRPSNLRGAGADVAGEYPR